MSRVVVRAALCFYPDLSTVICCVCVFNGVMLTVV